MEAETKDEVEGGTLDVLIRKSVLVPEHLTELCTPPQR
jgi:hypothetical protein